MMENLEETYLEMALEYKKEYESLPWYKFSKRAEAKSMWYSARDLMVRNGLRRQEEERIRKIVREK